MTEVAIFVLGLAGFWVARHIRAHKQTEAPLVCPIGFDCTTVVHSDYSRFMGMPVEVLGMVYYGAVSLVYLYSLVWRFLEKDLGTMFMGVPVHPLMMLVSLAALLFSVYLVSIQAFVLKNWCSWCLVSAGISILIFILTVL